jgi:MICOS complex subunit MIC26
VSFQRGLVLSRLLNVRPWPPYLSCIITSLIFLVVFVGRVKSIIVPEEPLTPGLLYVGVSALTGSILARNRSILIRFALPPTLLLLSFDHFLPKTYHNLSSYLGTLEDKYLPAVAEKHDVAKAHTAMTWGRIKDATKDGRATLGGGVERVVHKAQDTTGLKFTEVLGWGNGVSNKALVAAKDIVEQAKEVEQKVEHVVEEKLVEVTRRAEERVEKVGEEKDTEIKRSV